MQASMDVNLKEWIQALSWAVAAVGGVIAAFKAVSEMRLNRKTQERDLRWKQALTWKDIFSQMRSDKRAAAAMEMLDWRGDRNYEIAPWATVRVCREDVTEALRTSAVTMTERELFIRSCFDSFFEALAAVERYLEIDLINPKDVNLTLEDHISELEKDKGVFQSYIDAYGNRSALRFLERMSRWRADLRKRAEARLIHSPFVRLRGCRGR
jgi:hypothetical protein